MVPKETLTTKAVYPVRLPRNLIGNPTAVMPRFWLVFLRPDTNRVRLLNLRLAPDPREASGSHVPEVGNELTRLAEIGTTEPWSPQVIVHMDMEHTGVVSYCELHRGSHCVGVERTSISIILQISIVPKAQVPVCQN
jgi:hypothetical protein